MFPAEAHTLPAACWPEAVWAPLWVAEQGFKEAPPPCTAQAGWDDQRNEISYQPAAPSGKELFPLFILSCLQCLILYWSVQVLAGNCVVFCNSLLPILHLPCDKSFVLICLSAYLLTYRCWELTHQDWLQQPPPSPLTSPISLMSCSPAMSFFNTSSSSVIGHTEHFSASSPKSLQCNDNPSTFVTFLSTTWLQSSEDTWSPASAKGELGPYQCALQSIASLKKPKRQPMTCVLNNVSFHQSQEGCTILQPVTTIKITVNANCQFNYNDNTMIPQTLF